MDHSQWSRTFNVGIVSPRTLRRGGKSWSDRQCAVAAWRARFFVRAKQANLQTRPIVLPAIFASYFRDIAGCPRKTVFRGGRPAISSSARTFTWSGPGSLAIAAVDSPASPIICLEMVGRPPQSGRGRRPAILNHQRWATAMAYVRDEDRSLPRLSRGRGAHLPRFLAMNSEVMQSGRQFRRCSVAKLIDHVQSVRGR